jgi:hypothetical protein
MKIRLEKWYIWLKKNIFIKEMFIYIVIAALIFYIPLWIFIYYGKLTGNDYLYGLGIAYVAFWAGPFTPTIPIILAIAIFLKQIIKKIYHRKED